MLVFMLCQSHWHEPQLNSEEVCSRPWESILMARELLSLPAWRFGTWTVGTSFLARLGKACLLTGFESCCYACSAASATVAQIFRIQPSFGCVARLEFQSCSFRLSWSFIFQFWGVVFEFEHIQYRFICIHIQANCLAMTWLVSPHNGFSSEFILENLNMFQQSLDVTCWQYQHCLTNGNCSRVSMMNHISVSVSKSILILILIFYIDNLSYR